MDTSGYALSYFSRALLYFTAAIIFQQSTFGRVISNPLFAVHRLAQLAATATKFV